MRKAAKILLSILLCMVVVSVIGGGLYVSGTSTGFVKAYWYVMGLQLIYGIPFYLVFVFVFPVMAGRMSKISNGRLWMHFYSSAYGCAWGLLLSVGFSFEPKARQLAESLLTFGLVGLIYGTLHRYWINPPQKT